MMLVRKIIICLFVYLVSLGNCFCADMPKEATTIVNLIGDCVVVVPTSVNVRQKVDMEDFAFYEFFDVKGKMLLSMYIGNQAGSPSQQKSDSIVLDSEINGMQIKFITNRVKKRYYSGEFYIYIAHESNWPRVVHIMFQKLSINEYDKVKEIALSLKRKP